MTGVGAIALIAVGSIVLIVSLRVLETVLVWRIAARLWRYLLRISLRPSGQPVNQSTSQPGVD